MRKHLISSIVIILAVMFCNSAFADGVNGSSSANDINFWKWTKEEWTGTDKPYAQVRLSIEQYIRSKKDLPALITKFKKDAEANQSKPISQFRWAYATYQSAIMGSKESSQQLSMAVRGMATAPSPKSYEYARLRFLIMARSFPQKQLKSVGERIVKRNPKDYDAKYYMLSILRPGLSSDEKKQALEYCQDLIRLRPNRPSAYSGLGGVYYRSWLISKSRSDSNNAIAAYQKYLKIAPPNEGFRSQAQRLIKIMQQQTK